MVVGQVLFFCFSFFLKGDICFMYLNFRARGRRISDDHGERWDRSAGSGLEGEERAAVL